MNIDYNAVIEILKSFLNNEKIEILGISVGEERQVKDAIRNLLTAYEKEKEKNEELEKKIKKLNLIRLQFLVSSFPDTTETYKKYRKELDELLKEE